MPSSSKKQHNFMAAIAHSPSFAKKVGVSQSVGKDFNAADKGKTFNKGGMMKMRKFAEAGYVDDSDMDDEGNTISKYSVDPDSRRAHGLRDEEPTPKRPAATRAAAPRAAATPTRSSTTSPSSGVTPEQETALQKRESEAFETTLTKGAKKRAEVEAEKTSAPRMGPMRGGRVKDEDGVSRYASEYISPERKKEIAKDLAIEAVTSVPAARVAQLTYRTVQAAKAAKAAARARDINTPIRELISERRAAGLQGHKSGGKIMGFKKGGMANFEKSGKDVEKKGMKEGSKADIALDKKQMMGMNMGGMTRKFGKGGMPMKDGKPAFMKKFAKGGGIESRGKTKGTIIRMASGGSVSSASRRADGIAQRGKTRC